MNLLLDLHHAHKLSEWLSMKRGIRVDGSVLFRQNKDVYEQLCASLDIPLSGTMTKPSLIATLKNHVFTAEQHDDLEAFKAAKIQIERRELRKARIDQVAAGPRPYRLVDQIAIDMFYVSGV